MGTLWDNALKIENLKLFSLAIERQALFWFLLFLLYCQVFG